MEEWNETAQEIPQKTLPELFEEQVERTPEAVAVVYEDRQLSYEELNARANRLAHYLINERIGPEDVVAIALPRSLEMIIALLDLKRAAYLPLDPEYPAERLQFVMEDAAPSCVITKKEEADLLPEGPVHFLLDDWRRSRC